MFSEPTINPVSNLFSAPGLVLDQLAASVLAIGILCYLARVAWISLSYARRMEVEARQATVIPSQDAAYGGPYCAG
ncbi:MAG: hypothetical protein JWP89_3425 [Schlesneria sp.]|nr:hypothetical protein [Schlesneria sp.]